MFGMGEGAPKACFCGLSVYVRNHLVKLCPNIRGGGGGALVVVLISYLVIFTVVSGICPMQQYHSYLKTFPISQVIKRIQCKYCVGISRE